MLDLLAIIRDTLIHPTQLLLNMHRQRYRYRQVLLVMALWLGFWWLAISCSLLLFKQTTLMAMVLKAVAVVILMLIPHALAVAMGTSNSFRYRIADGLYLTEPVFLKQAYYAFWLIRTQIAWFPTMFIVSSVIFQAMNLDNLMLLVILLLLVGCIIGSFFIMVYIGMPTMLSTRILLSLMLLWMMLGVLPTIGTIWFSSVFFLAGLWIGIVRPLSWLWQSLLSLTIAGLLRFAREPWRWWRYHPALYDELALLPLVGLSWSLRQLYHLDPYRGFKALIAVYRLSAQRPAVRRAIKRLLHDPRYSPSLFWQLGSDPQGILLLQQLNRHWRCLHPLIKPMTACTRLEEPQAWPALITTIQPMLAVYATNPAFQRLSDCLQLIATILTSTEAQPAYRALHNYKVEPDSLLERALIELQSNYQLASDQPLVLPPTGALLTGWPRHALLSTIEQLNFLQILAKQQG